jgi:hypothetical protein
MTEATDEAASKDELAGAIAGELGHATDSESIRARLREYLIAAVDPEDSKRQREQLRAIEQDCLKAAKSVWSAPQELDWFPKGVAASSAPALTRDRITALFANNIRKAERAGNRRLIDFLRMQFKKFENGTLKLEQEKVEPLVQAVIGPSELSFLLNEVSKAAGQAADRLPPKRRARGIPQESLAAHYAWLLVQEFYQRPPKKLRFPWSKFLTVTALFHEYVTGEHKEPESFDTACRKVLKATGDR